MASMLTLASVRSAQADTYVVTKIADTSDGSCDADCSLREAVTAANASLGDDVITFDPLVFSTPQTIVLSAGALPFTSGSVDLTGPGSGLLTITSNNISRLLEINGATAVRVSQITLFQGYGGGSLWTGYGGCILNVSADVTLTSMVIWQCTAGLYGGGVANVSAGGLAPAATLTIRNSSVQYNAAYQGGGGIYSSETSRITIARATIIGNASLGGEGGGGALLNGSADLTNVTIVENDAAFSYGAGLMSGGTADQYVINVTIASNTGYRGPGLARFGAVGRLFLLNSIIADNAALPSSAGDVETLAPGLLQSLGSNIVKAPGASLGWTGTDRLYVDPMLSALSDHGGGLLTRMPLPGSPAVDGGQNCVLINPCGSLVFLPTRVTEDARGVARPAGRVVDIGAVELEAAGKMVRANLDGNPQDDLVIDAGAPFGISLRMNNNSWQTLTLAQSRLMLAADLDGNGRDELVFDFGGGLQIRSDTNTWSWLLPISPRSMLAANIDGVAGQELVIDFGPPHGIWTYRSPGTWTQLHLASAQTMATGDVDGNGQDDVIIDFGGYFGIWVWKNNSRWEALHPYSPQSIVVADLDGSGRADVVIDFGPPYGIWIHWNDSNWQQLHPLSPDTMAVGDFDGNGQADVATDFGSPHGIWLWMNGSTWQQIHLVSPESMLAADLDGNGRDELVIDFGNSYGVWVWQNNATWVPLTGVSP